MLSVETQSKGCWAKQLALIGLSHVSLVAFGVKFRQAEKIFTDKNRMGQSDWINTHVYTPSLD